MRADAEGKGRDGCRLPVSLRIAQMPHFFFDFLFFRLRVMHACMRSRREMGLPSTRAAHPRHASAWRSCLLPENSDALDARTIQ